MIDHNDDWRVNLKVMADRLREQQKNKKGETHKGDTIENFRGKKGFNDTGIPLSPKAAKKLQRNRLNYHYKYPMHLQRINERRKKDAEDRWGIKPVPATSSSISERHGNRSSRWTLPTRSYDDARQLRLGKKTIMNTTQETMKMMHLNE